MIRSILLFAAIPTLLWSCSSENSEKDTATAASTPPAATAKTDTPQSNTLTQAVQPKDGAMAPQNEVVGAGAKGKAAAEVKLNPAHGQPGHSCSVPVGAPLTAAATAPSALPQPVQAAPAAAPQAQQLLPNGKVNPPHGQPGHVCM